MLLRFGVENFRSVRDYQEIVFTASKRLKRSGATFPVPVVAEEALPVAACYGANAAGKSNLIAAVASLRDHVVRSHKARDATDAVPRQPFRLDRASVDRPTRLDCTLVITGKAEEDRASVYEYGFEFNDREYSREWLHRTVRAQRRANQLLFERRTVDGETNIRFGSHLTGENRSIAALTRPNSLFLSAAAQNNHAQLSELHREFAEKWKILEGRTSEFRLAAMLGETEHQDALMALIQQADLGIVGVEVVDEDGYADVDVNIGEDSRDARQSRHLRELRRWMRLNKRVLEPAQSVLGDAQPFKRVRFTHIGSDLHADLYALDYDLESRGTQRLAELAMPALAALNSGALVVVDELDASLHPRLTAALVKLFKGPSNRSGAQLLCTLHDASVLKGLEADEVWMAEKDRSGATKDRSGTTSFTPLTDYRLRSRDDLEQVYRDGRVGGAAVIGDLAAGLDS